MKVTREKAVVQDEQVTVAKAFDWYWDQIIGADPTDARRDEFNRERAVLAVGYLLQFCSDGGNADVDRYVAFGLGEVLHKIASGLPEWMRAADQSKPLTRSEAK